MDLTRRGFLKLACAVVGGLVAKKISGDMPPEDKYKDFGLAQSPRPISSLISDGITTSSSCLQGMVGKRYVRWCWCDNKVTIYESNDLIAWNKINA